MATIARKVRAGLVQMTSVNDVAANLRSCSQLVADAVGRGCEIVFFPECFSFIGAAAGEAQRAAEPLTGPVMQRYLDLAKQHAVWLSLGGFQERVEGEERIYNTHVVVDTSGTIRAAYRKIHLYDVPMVGLVESKQALAGSELVCCDSVAGRLGVTICYDMRFPELYQKLTFMHGAEVLLVPPASPNPKPKPNLNPNQVLLMPSAFAVKTGEAHWETLLRCRAIETQCYVVAAAQAGQHNTDGNQRRSYGHSLAFDPWGKCVARLDDPHATGVATFEIDAELLRSTRQNMPMHEHRRYDLYGDGPHQTAKEDAADKGTEGMFFG